jgi:hypothetical protein
MLIDPLVATGRFHSAKHRVERANEHRSTLDTEIQAFTRGERSAVPMQLDPYLRDQPMPDWVRQQVEQGLAHMSRPSGPAWSMSRSMRSSFHVGDEAVILFMLWDNEFLFRWGVILGDLVHCLRSALDNVAWAATVINQATLGNTPPPRPFPWKSPWSDVAFPIFTDPAKWPNAVKKNLWGVGPVFEALIEEHQPYNCGKPTPEDAALYILRELSNIDKHHGVNFLATKAQVQAIKVPAGTTFTPKTTWELIPGAEVGHIRFLTQEAADSYLEQVDMDLGITFEIAFGKGTPAEGRPVWEVISAMSREVDRLVGRATSRIDRSTGRIRSI